MILTFERAFEKYKAFMLRSNYSPVTIQNKYDVIFTFKNWLSRIDKNASGDLKLMTCEIMLEYMDSLYLRELYPYTIQIYMTYLRSFFKFLYADDSISQDPTRKIPTVKVPKKDIKFIAHEEIMEVLEDMLLNMRKKGCRYKTAMRDYFIIRCAYVTGWRASESLGCDPANINWDTGEVYLPRRKGGKDGRVYLDNETATMLKGWYYSNYPAGKRLWYSNQGKPLNYNTYNKVFKSRFGVGSHRIRASMATYFISKDVGIKDVADMLGHESVVSTMRYAACLKTRIKDIHALNNPFSK